MKSVVNDQEEFEEHMSGICINTLGKVWVRHQ